MSKGDEQKNLVEARSLRMAVTGAHSRDVSCILMVKCLLHTEESHRGLVSMEVEVTEVVLARCQKRRIYRREGSTWPRFRSGPFSQVRIWPRSLVE